MIINFIDYEYGEKIKEFELDNDDLSLIPNKIGDCVKICDDIHSVESIIYDFDDGKKIDIILKRDVPEWKNF